MGAADHMRSPQRKNLHASDELFGPNLYAHAEGALGLAGKGAGADPKAEAEALLLARLAPDMFPLSTQIRFACVQVHESTHRVQG
jgi:hypothetical protein